MCLVAGKWKLLGHVKTVCDPMDYIVYGLLQARILESFSSPGDLSNPGIEPRSPALRADSLPAEPQGKPKNTGVGSLSLLVLWPRNQTRVSCIAGRFFTNWVTREAPWLPCWKAKEWLIGTCMQSWESCSYACVRDVCWLLDRYTLLSHFHCSWRLFFPLFLQILAVF